MKKFFLTVKELLVRLFVKQWNKWVQVAAWGLLMVAMMLNPIIAAIVGTIVLMSCLGFLAYLLFNVLSDQWDKASDAVKAKTISKAIASTTSAAELPAPAQEVEKVEVKMSGGFVPQITGRIGFSTDKEEGTVGVFTDEHGRDFVEGGSDHPAGTRFYLDTEEAKKFLGHR